MSDSLNPSRHKSIPHPYKNLLEQPDKTICIYKFSSTKVQNKSTQKRDNIKKNTLKSLTNNTLLT